MAMSDRLSVGICLSDRMSAGICSSDRMSAGIFFNLGRASAKILGRASVKSEPPLSSLIPKAYVQNLYK